MADEIELNATLAYDDAEGQSDFLQVVAKFADVDSKGMLRFSAQVPITELELVAGGISGFGWIMIINRDATNFVELRVSTGGARIAKMLPGEFVLLRKSTGMTDPYLIADTATCKVDVLMILT